ncbi:glycosyltransferase [Cetobacterium sp.]|uniref:glycosyltransferase n=1 Tax=Cetobacterium sp. TaxID=2071632 RepID=UPI002FC5C7C9
MKLAIVNNDLGSGGAEKLIYDMALKLKNDKLIKFDIVLLNSKNAVYKKDLEKEGINIISLDSKFGIYNPLYILKLIKILRNYNVVHGHVFPSQYWVGLAAKFLPKNIKFITTEHSTTNGRRGKKLFKYLDSFVYDSYHKIIGITSNVKYNLDEWIVIKDKDKRFRVIENGIDLKKYNKAIARKREDFGLKEDDIILTMIARLSNHKDHKTLIRSMKELPSNYKLLLLGEGELKEELIKLTEELKIRNRIQFLGFRKDGAEILKMSDIGVLSSNFEGLSLSAIEVMASGCPLIASRVSGLEEMVDGIGVLYDHKNINDLKVKILKLGTDLEYRKKIQQNCIKKSKEYCLEKMVEKYKEVYK